MLTQRQFSLGVSKCNSLMCVMCNLAHAAFCVKIECSTAESARDLPGDWTLTLCCSSRQGMPGESRWADIDIEGANLATTRRADLKAGAYSRPHSRAAHRRPIHHHPLDVAGRSLFTTGGLPHRIAQDPNLGSTELQGHLSAADRKNVPGVDFLTPRDCV